MFCQSVIKMSCKVLTLSERVWSHQTTWRWEKFSWCYTDNGQPIYYIYIHTHVHVYIYVKPPDEYPWQGRNSFNSGIFVILKKLWTLNYKWPLLSSQFLPALKWLLKSSLTMYKIKNKKPDTVNTCNIYDFPGLIQALQ